MGEIKSKVKIQKSKIESCVCFFREYRKGRKEGKERRELLMSDVIIADLLEEQVVSFAFFASFAPFAILPANNLTEDTFFYFLLLIFDLNIFSIKKLRLIRIPYSIHFPHFFKNRFSQAINIISFQG